MQGQIEAGKTVTQFEATLSRFLSKCPFANARIIAAHFGVALDSVQRIRASDSV
jgi:hypothetical protein